MPAVPDNHDAHDYAERIRARLPRRLRVMREAAVLSKYALARKAGVSRDMVGCIESGESIPTIHVTARLAREPMPATIRARCRCFSTSWTS